MANTGFKVGNESTDISDVLPPRFLFLDRFTEKTIFLTGANTNGQLGLGNLTPRSSPVQVGGLTNWRYVDVYSPNLTFGVKSDGTLWAWGENAQGSLGLGNLTPRSSPVQVGSLTNWKMVVGSTDYNCGAIGVKTDGTLWSWGFNSNGQLGLGDVTDRSSPVQVGSLTNWKSVSAGFGRAMAIKTDGTLWSCGGNTYGQLGLGDVTHRSSPVQVGSLTNWKSISAGDHFSTGIKTDGTLWTWGRNTYGQLGLGDVTHRSSPVQVGSLTDWKYAIACSDTAFGIKTDGTLWSWGRNNFGQLGLGDVTDRSSPVQVGSLTNWSLGHANRGASIFFTKTDGTLWACGRNDSGQLGLGDLVSRSSPVQVGSASSWRHFSLGGTIGSALFVI